MELERLSATELGSIVNSRAISPVEVIDYFFDRIEKRNPSINAFVYTMYYDAISEANKLQRRLDKGENCGRFAGVPIGLKDFLPSKKGWSASHGGVRSLITVDPYDDILYTNARRLGAIAVGKTNAPAFGFRGTTDNKMYGPTSTPFKVGYNSGGSSGGSCAAVASGMVPFAITGDGGGSTRIPAAWCSCFGFKPSAGIVPSVCRPDAWTATHPYCCGGYATKTVHDSAILMTLAQGYDPKDPISIPDNIKDFTQLQHHHSVKGMRVAVTHDYNIFPAVEPEIVEAVDRIASYLSEEGAEIEYVKFDFKHSIDEMIDSWLLGISIDDAVTLEVVEAVDDHPEDFPDEFIKWHRKAREASMLDYRKFHEIRTDILDAMLKVHENHDIILSPVSCCMPVPNASSNTKGPTEILGIPSEPLIGFGQTWFYNMTGDPAASIPAGLSKDGLPIGIQIASQRYKDENVYQVAYLLEQICPWRQYYDYSM